MNKDNTPQEKKDCRHVFVKKRNGVIYCTKCKAIARGAKYVEPPQPEENKTAEITPNCDLCDYPKVAMLGKNKYKCAKCGNEFFYHPPKKLRSQKPEDASATVGGGLAATPAQQLKTPEDSGNVPRSMRAYWKQQTEQLQQALAAAKNRNKEFELKEAGYDNMRGRESKPELHKRIGELEKLLEEEFKDKWRGRNGSKLVDTAWQQYKLKHPTAFKNKD